MRFLKAIAFVVYLSLFTTLLLATGDFVLHG